MAAGSGIRIGDAEREAVANSLREHYAKGRLDLDEFQQRLDATFAAKTDTDLAKLTADLPVTSPYAAPWPPTATAAAARSYPAGSGRRYRRGAAACSYSWISVCLILLCGFLILVSWPLAGLPKVVLIALAVFGFGRRIMRRIMGGGGRAPGRRGRWL